MTAPPLRRSPGPTGAVHGSIGSRNGAVLTGPGRAIAIPDVPGPGAHEMPGSIRPGSSPAFSMGPKPACAHRGGDILSAASHGPGPAAYDTRGHTAAATADSPRYGFGTALRPLDRRIAASERTPGPASYEEAAATAFGKGMGTGTGTISRAERGSGFEAPDAAPGPADYVSAAKPTATKVRSRPGRAGWRTCLRSHSNSSAEAPGSQPSTPSFSMGRRLAEKPPTSAAAPGPGAYVVAGSVPRGGRTVRARTLVRGPRLQPKRHHHQLWLSLI